MKTLHGIYRCDGCGALCSKAAAFLPRPLSADGITDVASYFETTPRMAKLNYPQLGLIWCCECHEMGSYCHRGEHELKPEMPRFDGRLIQVALGQRGPRCLSELTGEICEQSERGIAHGH